MENNGENIKMDPIPGWETYRFWLNRLKPSTAKTAGSNFMRWMDWLGREGGKFQSFSPDQMIEYQRSVNNEQRYELLDLAQRYIGGLKGRTGYVKNQYNTVRSFFAHNRAELPQDPAFKVRGTVEKVVGYLEASEIRDVILSCNSMYQAVFTSMFSAALDKEMFVYWNTHGWDKLRSDLRGDPKAIRIDLPGRKSLRNEAPYYSFVCNDAVDLLRRWLLEREKLIRLYTKRYPGYVDPGSIFIGQKGEPIGKLAIHQVWSRHCRRLGLLNAKMNGGANRFGKNLHELRDSFRSLYQKSGADTTVAEFCMGHVVDKLGYNKATQDEEWTRGEYMKAMTWLNILSSPKPHGFEDRDEVKRLQRDLEEAKKGQNGETEAMKAEIKRQGEINKALIEEVAEIRKLLKNNEKVEVKKS